MTALIVIFISALISLFIAFAKKPFLVLLTSVTGLLSAIVLLINEWNHPVTLFQYEGLLFDHNAILYSIAAILFTLLSIVIGYHQYKSKPAHTGDYISLLMFSLVGAVCMIAFTDMFMFFLGLEIMSIPIYVMAGSNKQDIRSSEAALKYFLMGAFATGVLLFGIAWLYGATGSFKIDEIAQIINSQKDHSALLYVGVLLIMASFLFKVGAAPFHFWSPDVYQGSPNNVTGFMAAVVKIGAFSAFYKIFLTAFPTIHHFWAPALAALAVITMFVGNLSALSQVTFKRLLAYSSISNVGYALLAILVAAPNGATNLWIYLVGYGFAIIALVNIGQLVTCADDKIESFKGLAQRNPFVGIVAIVALLSVAGVPPLVGFFGKYVVFANAFSTYPVLVLIAIVNSGIGIYYYLKMIITILDKEPITNDVIKTPLTTKLVLGICLFVLTFGSLILSFLDLL